MKRRLVVVTAVSLLALAACGDDKGISLPQGSSATTAGSPESTSGGGGGGTASSTPGGVTLPVSLPDSLPANLSKDCLRYAQAFSLALSGDASGVDTLDEAFDKLGDVVPDDLKDDFKVLSDGYAKLIPLLKGANPGAVLQNPEALKVFTDPKFAAASQKVSAWLSTECTTG
jgi:hypothetical protein